MERHYTSSDDLRLTVRQRTEGVALLSFSAGKDAVATWIALRESRFERVLPFYLYIVPGLEFVEDGLAYYERVFKTPILRLPHPSAARMLRNLTFQPPERAAVLETVTIPNIDYPHVEACARRRFGVSDDIFVGIGTRTADSPIRLANVRRYGALNPGRRSFFPIFDWRIDDVRAALARAHIQLTVDYRLFGRSFDGIDYRFLAPIKEHFPRDYARILEWFPLADLELFRRQLGRRTA